MSNLPLVLVSLLFLQSSVAAQPAPVSSQNPITMDLMTVIDHPGVLGGERVKVRIARVKEIVGPRLVIVNEPRIRGIDRTYETYFRLDKLLVLLPDSVSVARGQHVAITGVVRTVAGGRALGLPVDEPYQVHDLLGGGRYLWHGARNYVELDPRVAPAQIFRVRRRVRTERDFDYFL